MEALEGDCVCWALGVRTYERETYMWNGEGLLTICYLVIAEVFYSHTQCCCINPSDRWAMVELRIAIPRLLAHNLIPPSIILNS